MSTLLIGNKNYSSWSLRPWLFLRKAGFKFDEQIVYLDAGDYQQQIAALSPSRRVHRDGANQFPRATRWCAAAMADAPATAWHPC